MCGVNDEIYWITSVFSIAKVSVPSWQQESAGKADFPSSTTDSGPMLYDTELAIHFCAESPLVQIPTTKYLILRYLGTTTTNKNMIQEEIKRRSNSGNACYHSVQNLLSSRLLRKK
jgi:hypothetical protein